MNFSESSDLTFVMFSKINSIVLMVGLTLGQATSGNANSQGKSSTVDSTAELAGGSVDIQAFPDDSLNSWKEKSFAGNTRYELLEQSGIRVLKATTLNSASVLYKQENIDLTGTPWLEWSWKIESIFDDIDETSKSGDDFPARLYVTAKTGAFPWQTVAINYVWSSELPIDSFWLNPYTNKSMMAGYAVMVDGDNSSQSGTAYFGNIAFVAN